MGERESELERRKEVIIVESKRVSKEEGSKRG